MHFGLAAEYFTSRTLFDLETERIFGRNWLAVGRTDDLIGPRELATTCIENALALVTHDGQQLRAFHNICRHRGATLVDADRSPLEKGCLTCPYHAWSYDAQGALIAAPNMQQAAGWDARSFGLLPIGCTTWCGYLLLNLDAASPPMTNEFASFAAQQQAWSMPQLQVVQRLEYEVQANWKLLFQNYSECYHCPTVHPALSRLSPFKSASNNFVSGPILGGPMRLVEGAETLSTDGRRIAAPLPHLSSEQRRLVYFYTIFPNLFVSNHPDYVMVHRLRRLDVGATAVTCEFLLDPAAIDSADPQRAVEFWDLTNRQDWHVCERVQRGATTTGYRPGPYSPFESVLPQFDAYYLNAMARPGELLA